MALRINKRKTLEAAQKYCAKGAFDKALKEYQKLLQADPKDTNVRLKIGDVYQRKGNQDQAIEAYGQVAEIFANEGFDAKSVAIYKQILRIDSASVEPRVRLGDLYQRLGLPSDALREFQAAVKVYQERGLKNEAFDLLKRVSSLDPGNIPNRLSLADLLMRENMQDQARDEYESLLAEVERQGDWEGLERVAARVLESFAGHGGALAALAKSKVQLGTASEAAELLKKALPKLPDDIAVREALVTVYEADGDHAAAQSLYREIAELYKRRGDNDKARDILQRFVPVEPFSAPDTAPGLDLSTGDGQELVLAASTVEAVDPLGHDEDPITPAPTGSRPDEMVAEARVLLEFDNLDEAERIARQVLKLETASDGGRSVLAEICAKRGDHEQAKRLQRERLDLANAVGDAELAAEIEARLRELSAEAPTPAVPIPEAAPAAQPTPVVSPPPPPLEPSRAIPPLRDDETPGLEDLPDIELVLEDEEDQDSSLASVEPPDEIAEQDDSIEIEAEADIEIEAEADIEIELDDDEPETVAPVPPPVVEEPAAAAPAAVATDASAGEASSSWAEESAAISEQVEEAEFYFQQEMYEEAESAFRKILERVPHHPQVMLRLGELENMRGDAPAAPPAAEALGETKVSDDEIPSLPELSIEGLDVSGPSDVTLPSDHGEEPEPDSGEIEVEALLEPEPEPESQKPEPKAAKPKAKPKVEPEPEPEPVVVEADAEDDGGEVFDPGSLLDEEPETQPEPEEGGDFDLAAELDEAQAPDALSQTGSGAAFDEVFAAFKKGISEQIGEDEADAHYDLAIAYREMGLFEDAVRELELVRRGGGRELEALSMIGACKLELGMPDEAIALISDALKLPEAIGEVVTALRYDLGSAYEAAGQASAALEEFKQVIEADPGFRDASDRVSELEKSG